MSLFQLSHRDDPPTSKAAIAKLDASGVRMTHEQLVMAAVTRLPGRTAPELKEPTGLDEYQVRRRLNGLKIAGRVVRCDARKCTVKGTSHSTWEKA